MGGLTIMANTLSSKGKRKSGGINQQLISSSSAPAKAESSEQNSLAEESSLYGLESDLNKRELALIEQEIKSLHMKDELERLRPLSGLYRVVKAMAKERKLDKIFEVITRETQEMLDCDRCSVFVLDSDSGELWTQIAQGLVGQRVISISVNSISIVSECALSGQIISIADAYVDRRFDPEVDRQTGYRTKSVLCATAMVR
jgi:hypothetical protein